VVYLAVMGQRGYNFWHCSKIDDAFRYSWPKDACLFSGSYGRDAFVSSMKSIQNSVS